MSAQHLKFSLNNIHVLLQIQYQTSPRQSMCPALHSKLVIYCLGYCNSLCGPTPPSPYNSSRTPQHASSSCHLPGPSNVIPLIQSLNWLLGLNTKSYCWQTRLQRDPHMHATGCCPGPHTPACSAFPPPLAIQPATSIHSQSGCGSRGSQWLSTSFIPPLLFLQFLLKYPVYISYLL